MSTVNEFTQERSFYLMYSSATSAMNIQRHLQLSKKVGPSLFSLSPLPHSHHSSHIPPFSPQRPKLQCFTIFLGLSLDSSSSCLNLLFLLGFCASLYVCKPSSSMATPIEFGQKAPPGMSQEGRVMMTFSSIWSRMHLFKIISQS